MHYRKRKVELGSSDCQPVNNHNKISLKNVVEICIVFVVNTHVVVSDDGVVIDD